MRFWCHQPTHPQRSGERPGQGRDDRPAGPCRPANGQALAEVALVMEPVRRPSGKVGNGVELDLPVSLQAAAGIAGRAAFTGAWIASSLRQTRQGPGGLQLSGLAAPDARGPVDHARRFPGGRRLHGRVRRGAARGARQHATGGAGPGPALVQGAGLLTVAAGLLRRDHMLLHAPGGPGASWRNNAHDAISGLIYASLVLAQLALARRFRRNPGGGPGAGGCWPTRPRPASSSSRTPRT
jgi:hypothetical protein